jgi:hypothetical protein
MSNNQTTEPEILYLVASVEPTLVSSVCSSINSNNLNSNNLNSNNLNSNNLNSNNLNSSSTTSLDSNNELITQPNKTIYLIVVDYVPKSYLYDYERAKELSYKYVSHLFLNETDRNYQSEWITDKTLVVRSYPKFSPTRYDRIDSIVEIYEVACEDNQFDKTD